MDVFTSLRLVFKYIYFTKHKMHKDKIIQPYFGLLNYSFKHHLF